MQWGFYFISINLLNKVKGVGRELNWFNLGSGRKLSQKDFSFSSPQPFRGRRMGRKGSLN